MPTTVAARLHSVGSGVGEADGLGDAAAFEPGALDFAPDEDAALFPPLDAESWGGRLQLTSSPASATAAKYLWMNIQ